MSHGIMLDPCLWRADGALYGEQYKGTTVADICPRTCHRCPGQEPLPTTDNIIDTGSVGEALDEEQAATKRKAEL